MNRRRADLVDALDTYMALIPLMSWIMDNPETLKGMKADEASRRLAPREAIDLREAMP
jgi:hypothetical protein